MRRVCVSTCACAICASDGRSQLPAKQVCGNALLRPKLRGRDARKADRSRGAWRPGSSGQTALEGSDPGRPGAARPRVRRQRRLQERPLQRRPFPPPHSLQRPSAPAVSHVLARVGQKLSLT